MKTHVTPIEDKHLLNGLTSRKSLIESIVITALLSILFIHVVDNVNTGIGLALFTPQQTEAVNVG